MKKLLFMVMVCGLLINACSRFKESPDAAGKPDNTGTVIGPGPNTTYSTPAALLRANAPSQQVKTVDASKPVSFTTQAGTQVQVPLGSLIHQDGTPVTGPVEFRVKEYMKKSDMVYSGITTFTTDGKLMKSGGMIDISAYANGKAVQIKPGANIQVTFPGAFQPDMEGFVGIAGDSNNTVVWRQDSAMRNRDSVGFGQNMIDLNFFSIVNLDQILQNIRTKMEIDLPDSCDGNNSKVYLVFKNVNAVAYLNHDYQREGIFWTGDHYTVPEGEPCKLVIVTVRNKVLRYAIKDITISNNHKEAFFDKDLKEISEKDFKAMIEKF